MIKRVLGITDEGNPPHAVRFSSDGLPGDMQIVHIPPGKPDRCLIDPFDPDHLIVAGVSFCSVSIDAGATWQNVSVGDSTEVRTLTSPVAGVLYMCTHKFLWKSVDGGFTWSHVSVGSDGFNKLDACFFSANVGWVIEADPFLTQSRLNYTLDGGVSWNLYLLDGVQGWITDKELAVRLEIKNYDTSGSADLVVLSTHSVHLITHSAAGGGTVSGQLLWSFVQAVQALLPTVTQNGFMGGTYWVNYFDDLHVRGTFAWIGGYNGLRAHSVDLAGFVIDQTSGVHENRELHWYSCVRSFNVGEVVLSLAEPGYAAPPLLSGYWSSLDSGSTYNSFQNVIGKEYSRGVSVYLMDEISLGCTDPSACNYDPVAGVDSGACQWTVRLSPCAGSDASALDTSTYSLYRLRCRKPAFKFFLGSIAVGQVDLSVKLAVAGIPFVEFQMTVPTGMSVQDQMQLFVGSLVAYINEQIVFRAHIIPAAYNPWMTGFFGAVEIVAPDDTWGNSAVNLSSFGFVGVTSDISFDRGNTGTVVQVNEFPGQCFTVCDAGNCLQAIPLTLASTHPSCSSCVPVPVQGGACMDCASQLSVSGTSLLPNAPDDLQCLLLGSVLSFDISVGFATHSPQVLVPVEAGQQLVVGQTVVLHFSSDTAQYFPAGSIITLGDSANAHYTVVSAVYDAVAGVTTLTLGGTYSGYGPIVTVTAFESCSASVYTTVEKLLADGTYSMVFSRLDVAQSGQVQAAFTYNIADYSIYRVLINATDCAGTRTCAYSFRICGDIVVKQGDCHNFYIGLMRPPGSFGTTANYQLQVTDLYDNSVVVSSQVAESSFPVKVIGSADTVYLISVTTPDGITQTAKLIDLCDLLKCRSLLIQRFLCEDPCLDDKLSNARKRERMELMRIGVVIGEIERMVYGERYRALGIPAIGEVQARDLADIAKAIALTRKLSARCADCEPKDDCDQC